jgi:two-component system, LytTR family, sensor histidine kinase AlgZ
MHPILADKGRLGLYLAAWLPLGGLLAALPGPGVEAWPAALALALPLALLYAFVCLAAWYPCRSTPLATSGALALVTTHGAAALAASALWLGAGMGWATLLGRLPATAAAAGLFHGNLPLYFGVGLLLYLLAVALHYLLIAFEESRAAEARALEIEVLAREAELSALKAQIDPHFLFNSLNSISSLCGADPRGAREMALALADFLRSSLAAGRRETLPLADELALAASYLAVEKIRFGPRLRVAEEVAPAARQQPVPPLLLQPLVENAVRHGISHLLDGGEVRIAARLAAGRLHLAVANPCDPERPARRGGGIGLANVRRRLKLLYGGDARLTVEERPESFRAEVELPAGGGPP